MPAQAVLDVMSWSQISMAPHYQYVSDELQDRIAG
jgi:hypothetical protein